MLAGAATTFPATAAADDATVATRTLSRSRSRELVGVDWSRKVRVAVLLLAVLLLAVKLKLYGNQRSGLVYQSSDMELAI